MFLAYSKNKGICLAVAILLEATKYTEYMCQGVNVEVRPRAVKHVIGC